MTDSVLKENTMEKHEVMGDHIGIDVGAKSVEVCVRRAGRVVRKGSFAQTPEGHRALIDHHAGQLARVVIEATGVYYLDLAVTLYRAGWPVAVINPRSFHHFAKLKLNRGKTDTTDAALLAEYGECMKPGLWQAPDDALMGLKRHRPADQPPDRGPDSSQEPFACFALEIEYPGFTDRG
jgi:transposase